MNIVTKNCVTYCILLACAKVLGNPRQLVVVKIVTAGHLKCYIGAPIIGHLRRRVRLSAQQIVRPCVAFLRAKYDL